MLQDLALQCIQLQQGRRVLYTPLQHLQCIACNAAARFWAFLSKVSASCPVQHTHTLDVVLSRVVSGVVCKGLKQGADL